MTETIRNTEKSYVENQRSKRSNKINLRSYTYLYKSEPLFQKSNVKISTKA